jgi:hypothetical protein
MYSRSAALLVIWGIALFAGADGARAFSTLTGVPLAAGPDPLYGSGIEQNNVVNSPGAPTTNSVLFDPMGPQLTSSTPWLQNGQVINPINDCGSCFAAVQWFFTGSESGLDITFHLPGAPDFTEGNQNNSAYSGGPPLNLAGGKVQHIGTSILRAGDQVQFSLSWANGSIDNSTIQATPTVGSASLIFSYFDLVTFDTTGLLSLTKTPTTSFVFALNDGDGGDDNHDDFVGFAIVAIGVAETEGVTPLPGTIVLFATGLGALGLLARRRKQRHLALS